MLWSINTDSCRGGCANRLTIHRPLVQGPLQPGLPKLGNPTRGTKALGEEVLAGYSNTYIWRVRIPFDQFEHPRNYLTKLMRYSRLLNATNSISELQKFVEASLLCWERRVPFGIYNMTNPGTVTTREVVDLIRKSGVCDREFDFFSSEDEFMRAAAKTPRSNCVMNSDKIRSVGIRITEVHEALECDLRNWTKCGLADGSSLDTQSQPLKPRLTMQRGAESNFMP